MWTTLAVLSFLGIILFIVLALISFFKETKKAKKWLIFAAGSFVLAIIFGSLMPQTETVKTSAKIEYSKMRELKEKKKDEAQEKKEKAAQQKEEVEAKEKLEKEAVVKQAEAKKS